MDERFKRALKMDYIKEEWLVLTISGPISASIKEERVFDVDITRIIKLMVTFLYLAGVALVVVAVILELSGIMLPDLEGDGEPESASGIPIFLAVVAFSIGTFYAVFFTVRKEFHTAIIADKDRGTIQVEQRFKNKERKPRVVVALDGMTQLETQSGEVYNSDGPNYNETAIYARGGNDQTTRLTWFGGVLNLEGILTPFNAWLKGKKQDVFTCRVPL